MTSDAMLAGTAAGFVCKILDYPLDTVKVLMQTQDGSRTMSKTEYQNAWHCLRYTVSTNGVGSLYRGISSPLVGCMAENAVSFWAYSLFKTALGENEGKDLGVTGLALAGAGAGAVVSIVNTPVELIKSRLQVQSSISARFRQYNGPMDVVARTIYNEGFLKGLYRGHLTTMAREIPGSFVWYGVYEGVCRLFVPEGCTKSDLPVYVHMLGGALSGIGYWTAFYPIDTVKSSIQTNPSSAGRGIVETFQRIYRRDGVRGLYRGWGVTILRAAPSHAAVFAVYEQSMSFLVD